MDRGRAFPAPAGMNRTPRTSIYGSRRVSRIRVQVKRLLRKYGYPPNLQEAAVQQVVKQAELVAAELAR